MNKSYRVLKEISSKNITYYFSSKERFVIEKSVDENNYKKYSLSDFITRERINGINLYTLLFQYYGGIENSHFNYVREEFRIYRMKDNISYFLDHFRSSLNLEAVNIDNILDVNMMANIDEKIRQLSVKELIEIEVSTAVLFAYAISLKENNSVILEENKNILEESYYSIMLENSKNRVLNVSNEIFTVFYRGDDYNDDEDDESRLSIRIVTLNSLYLTKHAYDEKNLIKL